MRVGDLCLPGQFFDDVGMSSYKVFTGSVQERTAILNRLADAIDASHEQSPVMTEEQKAQYQESEFNCPGCGCHWENSVSSKDSKVTPGAFIEEDVSVAPPDVQSAFYTCYSATWYITCQGCGTLWAMPYDNY